MNFATTVASRLLDLRGADPRVAWLPDKPAAGEAHLREDGSCDLVVGYAGTRFEELDGFVRRCAGDHAATWERWLAATGRNVLDAGAQLGADHHRLQVYLRGHYDPPAVGRAFAAIGTAASPRLVANALALCSVQTAEMLGLEFDGARVGAAIYVAVRNGGAEPRPLIEAIEFLLRVLQPPSDAATQWLVVADLLLRTATEEYVYISFEPTESFGWVKIDVGPRPLALAGVVAQRLGRDADAMLATATAHQMTQLSHVGLRFGGASPALSIYHSLL